MEIEIKPSRRPTPSAVPAPAAPPVVDPNFKVPTADELKDNLYESMGWTKPVVPETQRTAEPIAPQPAPPAPEPAPAPEPTPAPAPAPSPADVSQTIRETAREVAREVATAMAPRQPAPAATPQPLEMVEADAEDYLAAQYLDRTDRRFEGVAIKFLAWIKAVYAYEDEWMAAHPDAQFNPDDSEHDAWYAAHPCPIDRKTLDKAKISMQVEEQYERKVGPEMKRMKAEEVWKRESANVYLAANRLIIRLVEAVSPDMARVLVTADGTPDLSEANNEKAKAIDAVAHDVLDSVAAHLWPLLVELEKTVIPGLDARLTRNNGLHAVIIAAQEEEERRILNSPAESTASGKRFVTVEQWNALPDNDRAGCRTLTVDDVEEVLLRASIAQAKKSIEHADNVAKRKYGAQSPTPAPAPTPQPAPAPQPQPQAGKHRSPSISSPSDAVTQKTGLEAPVKSLGEQAVATHFA